jgi:hypothetical protein
VTARDLFSPDLLGGLDGIESGLRRRRSLGLIGAFGLLGLVALQLSLAILSVAKDVSWQSIVKQWYIAVPSIALAVTLVLLVAARYWLRESRTPFRYTCSIVDFDAVQPTPNEALPWLRHDLMELLNDRIGRLSFRDTEPKEPEEQEAHLHIAGEYIVRDDEGNRTLGEDDEGDQTLEVTPRVRVGGEHASQSLAHAVRYGLATDEYSAAAETLALKPEDYRKVLERVYFSVASHLYKRIRDDVERKIQLLPTRSLRATAYLFEAEDYAQSNTLDAYDDAQALFERARSLYTPSALRGFGLRVVGRHSKRQAMLARTELGLANTLVSRRALARLSGRRANQIFEAREIADCARHRLERLAKRKRKGADDALFDARVTLALTLHYLGSDDKADGQLKDARASMPDRAEEDPHYLFAAALLEPRTTSALSLLRRAVELRPRFEVAQFERARRTEALWQFRPDLEKTVADTVIAQYMEVVRINPGNIRAWSSLGHTYWLLAEDEKGLKEAHRYFHRGLEYKEIKRETFTAGLDYSLARVCAELGKFKDAYRHYVASTTASVGEGIAHGTWAEQHNSVVRNEAMLRRFAGYVDEVASRAQDQAGPDRVEPRIVCSVRAFVENDYGEACLNFYERTGKEKFLDRARSQYEKARATNKTYVVPLYNLCVLSRTYGKLTDAQKLIREVRRREPSWPEARLEEMLVEAWRSRKPADDWAVLEAKIETEQQELENLKNELKTSESAAEGLGDQAGPHVAARASGLGADAREIVAPGTDLDQLRAQIDILEAKLESRRGECERLRKALKESADEARETVHDLVPHQWLWRSPNGEKSWEFRWKVLHERSKLGRRAYDQRWARHFGDNHVRALETWAITRAFGRVDEAERGKLGRSHRTQDLLDLLETKFWPDRQEALIARVRLQLTGETLTERLGSLAARTLAFDPANFHLLTLADRTLSERDEDQVKRKREAFIEALGQRDVAPPVLAWLGKRLERKPIEDYESALKAYDGALAALHDADGGQQVDVDEATLLVGKARAEWGLRRYAAALATLARVQSGESGDEWRTEFVVAIAERDQVGPPKPATGLESEVTRNGRARRRFELPTFRRAHSEQVSQSGPTSDNGDLEAEVEEDAGYGALASWLRCEHAGGVNEGDAARGFDAGRALLRLAAARYAELAPNRTRRLPGGSASTGDVDSGTLPLVRRLALEVDWSAVEEREGEFLDFVTRERPAICERVEKDTGVPIPLPGVHIADSLPDGITFRVLVNELPVFEGRVEDGGYENVALVIEDKVRLHLKTLVGVDDVVRALDAKLPANDEETRDAVKNSDEAKRLMVQVVRSLIDDGMTVDLAEVAREVVHGNGDVAAHVRAIQARRRLDRSEPTKGRNGQLSGAAWVVSR